MDREATKLKRKILGLHVVIGANLILTAILFAYAVCNKVETNSLEEAIKLARQNRYTLPDAKADFTDIDKRFTLIERRLNDIEQK